MVDLCSHTSSRYASIAEDLPILAASLCGTGLHSLKSAPTRACAAGKGLRIQSLAVRQQVRVLSLYYVGLQVYRPDQRAPGRNVAFWKLSRKD
jgi:hypothetical protein